MKDPREIIEKYYFLHGERDKKINKFPYSYNNKNLNSIVFDVENKIIGDVCYCAEKLQMEYFEYQGSFAEAELCITDKINTAKEAALNKIKCVYLAERENIKHLYLPVLTSNDSDIEEIPPVCCILHKNSQNDLVPLYSRANLLNAIIGQVYPYWSLEYQC